ncbi:60S ribosomal protein L14-2 [Morus notabilis]|uniref:60S ribosomal protein L14-2 n=1 Tax=Morus notabilis TaxID=981085 RepID=W9RES9_9ROSA|nr:60S ribosomal protein L14-2 [Morus notabilis]
MVFKRYVEIGRVALVNYGKDYGKLVVIVDVIDQNRALVDAPDMVRAQMNFKRLSLTDIKVDIKRVPKKKTLIAAIEAADVKNKWENSSWGRKLIVQKRRASLKDFDRFKLMLAKIKFSPTPPVFTQARILSNKGEQQELPSLMTSMENFQATAFLH